MDSNCERSEPLLYRQPQCQDFLSRGRGVARGGLRGLEHPLCMLYNDVIQTQVKLTLYCFATLTLLLKLVAFVFKLKFTVAELAISCSTSTALVYTSSYCFSLGS